MRRVIIAAAAALVALGAAFFIVFTQLYTAIDLGRPAQIVGHITFTLSYVVVVVRGRLSGVGRTLDDLYRAFSTASAARKEES